MKRPAIILLAVACLGTLLSVALFRTFRQPSYQGRTLADWMNVYFSGYSWRLSPHQASDAERAAAEAAIRAISTNDLPTITSWVGRGDQIEVDTALRILGTNAEPFIPTLAQLATNAPPAGRILALEHLAALHADHGLIIGPTIQLACDTNIDLLTRTKSKSGDPCIRTRALWLLENVGLKQDKALRLLSSLTNDPNHDVATMAKTYVEDLDLFFPDAKPPGAPPQLSTDKRQ